MSEAISYARMSGMIKFLTEKEFFRKDDEEALHRQFPDLEKEDVYLRSRPYKFGLYQILRDEGARRAGVYHTDIKTRVAFELLKRLTDIYLETSKNERQYIRKLTRGAIKDDGQDLAAVLTEIEVYVNLKPHAERIEIGDGKFRPDIRVTNNGKPYDLQCKSLGISLEEIYELEGMFRLVKSIQARIPELSDTPAFAAWLLKDQALVSNENVDNVMAMTDNFFDYVLRKTFMLFERSELMHLVHHSRVSDPKAFFAKAFPPKDRFLPIVPELVCDPNKAPLTCAFLLMRIRDHEKLAERALKSFCRAMEQHDAMGSQNPIVYINIEYPSVLMLLVQDAPLNRDDHMFRSASFYQWKIYEKIKASEKWPSCRGLILSSSLAPRKSQNAGISWNRATSFFPKEGLDEQEALPAYFEMRKVVEKSWENLSSEGQTL